MVTMTGTIKRLTDKGFGFSATAEGPEYFFPQSACTRTSFDELREGQAVSPPQPPERSTRRETLGLRCRQQCRPPESTSLSPLPSVDRFAC